ncbi:MAG: Hsp70 family protein [Thermogutta sp.]
MGEEPIVGIDFGTSNSTIAWFDPETGRAEALGNAEGESKTPSMVYIGPAGEVIVGKLAEERISDPGSHPRIIRAVKRELAKKRVWYLDGRPWTSVEIAAEIIKKLKHDVERTYFRRPIERAVLTHPATFDELEKIRLREAAELAGLSEVALLEEPVAAAMAYLAEGQRLGKTILVYDLGGGTFDVTLLRPSDKGVGFHVAARPSGLRIGGEDFDRVLYEEVSHYIHEKIGPKLSRDTTDLRLLKRCRDYKENLSFTERPTPLSLFLPPEMEERISIEIARSRFEELICPHIDKTVESALEVLQEGGCDQVGSVILIGGSSRIPLIRRRLEEVLGVSPLRWDKADIAVALGAAYHAAYLWEKKVVYPQSPDSLRRALRRNSPSARLFPQKVLLQEGQYDLADPLKITVPLQLEGMGADKTFVTCDKEYVLRSSAKKFIARGITFLHEGKKPGDVVVVDSGSISFEGCRFSGAVLDAEMKLGSGLAIRGTTTGVVKECRFDRNQGCGVRLSGKASVAVENNVFEANGAGIVYEDNACGEAGNNLCRNNRVGIAIASSATATLRQNVCEGNKDFQIIKGKEARVETEGNVGTITENAGCLIAIAVVLTALGAGVLLLI